jgi:predicted phage tail protein
MTKVTLHGKLGVEFGREWSVEISKPSEIIDAIDANTNGFRKRLFELSNSGKHYAMVVDKERTMKSDEFISSMAPDKIDMVPVIAGAGLGIGALIVSFIGEASGALAAGAALTGGWAMLAGAIDFALMTATSMALSAMLAPKQKMQKGPEASISGGLNSYVFSGRTNTSREGEQVPIGYGLMLTGGKVIQSSVRSFPTKKKPSDVFGGDASSIGLDSAFTETAL